MPSTLRLGTLSCVGILGVMSLTAPQDAVAQSDARWPSPFPELKGQEERPNDAAIVVGVERYAYVSNINGAADNANAWYLYLRRVRGVPRGNTILLRDQEATRERLLEAVDEATARVGAGGTLWFIFIGHGAPSKDGKGGVLIGADAQQNPKGLYARSVSRRELLNALHKGPQRDTVVLLDACFNGRDADGATLIPGLQPLIPTSDGLSGPDSTLVLSASGADQFAGPLPRLDRPAFSYLMLGAIRGWADANGDQRVTAAEALAYTSDTLKVMVRNRRQSPQRLLGSPDAVLSQGAMESGPDLDAILVAQSKPESSVGETTWAGWSVGEVDLDEPTARPEPPPKHQIRFGFGVARLGTEVLSGQYVFEDNLLEGVSPMSDPAWLFSASAMWPGYSDGSLVDGGFNLLAGFELHWSPDLDRATQARSEDGSQVELRLRGLVMFGALLEPSYGIRLGPAHVALQSGVGLHMGGLFIEERRVDEDSAGSSESSPFLVWLSWPVRARVDVNVAENFDLGVTYSYYIFPSNLQQLQTNLTYHY